MVVPSVERMAEMSAAYLAAARAFPSVATTVVLSVECWVVRWAAWMAALMAVH